MLLAESRPDAKPSGLWHLQCSLTQGCSGSRASVSLCLRQTITLFYSRTHMPGTSEFLLQVLSLEGCSLENKAEQSCRLCSSSLPSSPLLLFFFLRCLLLLIFSFLLFFGDHPLTLTFFFFSNTSSFSFSFPTSIYVHHIWPKAFFLVIL